MPLLDVQSPWAQPGGPYAQWNALRKGSADADMAEIKAQYAPISTVAQALSQAAYAGLVGPQFVAKLMANKGLQANTENPGAITNSLVSAGMGASSDPLNSLLQLLPRPQPSLFDRFLNVFGLGNNQNTINNPPSQMQAPKQQPSYAPSGPGVPGSNAYQYDANGNNIPASPQEVEKIAANGNNAFRKPNISVNAPKQLGPEINLGGGLTGRPVANVGTGYTPEDYKRDNQTKFNENIGRAKGIEKEGETAGDIRAKDMNELGKTYAAAVSRGDAYKTLTDIVTTPEWQNMRAKIPFFQDKQLGWLSKQGTKEQQEMIGNFRGGAQEIVRQTINSFQGTKLRGELEVAKSMKISDNDTVSVALGKLQAAQVFNELDKQRSSLTNQIMKDQHLDRQTATQMADKQINGEAIRKQVYNQLHPKPTDIDIKHMSEKYKISEDEVKKRLKAKGLL